MSKKAKPAKDGEGKKNVIGERHIKARDVMREAAIAQIVQDDATGRKGDVSQHLLLVAQQCNKDADQFEAICKVEMDYIKSREGQVDLMAVFAKEHLDYDKLHDADKWELGKVPPCFTQAKSNIKAGMKLGLDPSKYKSESKFRADKIAKASDKKESDRKGAMTPQQTALETVMQAFIEIATSVSKLDDVATIDALTQSVAATNVEYQLILDKVMPKGEPEKEGEQAKQA